MIARILQFIFFVLLLRFVWRLIALAFGERSRWSSFSPDANRPPSGPPRQGEMVRDPVCGVYVLRQRAIEDRREGKIVHFCSERCRAAFPSTEARVS